MKLGQKVACGDALQLMLHWVTLTEGHSHSLYLTVKKEVFLKIRTISQILIIFSSVVKIALQVACGETFQMMCLWVTVTFDNVLHLFI